MAELAAGPTAVSRLALAEGPRLEAVSGVFNCGSAVEQAIGLAVAALLITPPGEHEGKLFVPALHATSLQLDLTSFPRGPLGSQTRLLAHATLRRRLVLPRPCRADGRTTSQTASGCLAATCSSTRAGPSGIRRPCSQLRSVFTLIPSRAANPSCDSRYVARRRFTFAPSTTKARDGGVSPRRMAPP